MVYSLQICGVPGALCARPTLACIVIGDYFPCLLLQSVLHCLYNLPRPQGGTSRVAQMVAYSSALCKESNALLDTCAIAVTAALAVAPA